MSVAGSTSSQGTRSRSPSRSRSPPYSDGRYPPSSRYSRYDSYNYRPNRNGMSAALDDYRDLRDRGHDRDRDRSMGLMRDDRYLSPRARESHDRYTPSYYRDDIPPHHYPSSSSPRDYPKTNPLRRDVSLDQVKDANKLTTSSSNNSIKDLKEDTKPITSNASEPYSSNRYMDWRDRDRDRERDRDRRYREDDRRRDYDRRGYMRDLRYESSSYGGPPPPPPMNYQMGSFGGDSYRPDRDRDRDMPPSPNIPYYERERIDDRDFYRPGRNSSASTNTIEYDRYRTRNRPNWANKLPEDAPRRLDRDRPERDRSPFKKLDDKKEDTIEKSSNTTTDGLETGEVVEEQQQQQQQLNSSTHIVPMSSQPSQSQLSSRNVTTATTTPPPLQDEEEEEEEKEDNADDHDKETEDVQIESKVQTRIESETITEPDTETVLKSESIIESKQISESKQEYESKQVSESQIVTEPKVNSLSPSPPPPPAAPPPPQPLSTERNKSPSPSPSPSPSSPLQPSLPSSQKQTEQQDEPKAEIVNESSSSRAESPMEISPEPITKPITTTTTTHQEQDSPQMEQGEVIEEDEEIKPEMTQEEIVNRIDDIETELSREEMLLAEAEKREQEALEQEALEQSMLEEEDEEEAATTAAQNKEEAKKQALQAMEDEPTSSAAATDLNNLTEDSVMRKRPQLLINQLRSRIDEEDDLLYEKILLDNKQVAKRNGCQTKEEENEWSDEEEWKKPLYPSIQDYPCYKENMLEFNQLRPHIAHALATQKIALAKKKIFLKKEFKGLYEQWKEKNLILDRVRERSRAEKFAGNRTSSRRLQEQQQQEEYIDGVIFVANSEDALRFSNGGASTPYNTSNYYTSDAARSEAELLEIIQSLESAEMRNPESRAKKTTATIPPMILDVRERMRTYDDRSRLVEDPLTYYHTGQDTGDVWNQQEITTFMESYMMYPKQFERISQAIGTKTACQCVLFYYRKKKKIDFKALMKKGRRGKANKNRDRIAAAIRLATSDSTSPTGRKAKSKGSALMTDIGEAQNSRKAKEKDAERKSRELRELEEANQYWESVAERKKTKRPSSGPSLPPTPSTPLPPTTSQSQQRPSISTTTSATQPGPSTSHISDDIEMVSTTNTEKRRFNTYSTNGTEKRRPNKGRSPRETNPVAVESPATLPNEPSNVTLKRYSEDQPMEPKPEDQEIVSPTATSNSVAKWSDREKETAVDAFKEHGRDFVQVSSLVKSKTEEQCRNFYHNFKRKFGPNAFNEEDTRPTTNEATSTAPTTNVHNELVAISGRTDLKAEEEDAAAALVGMFQMGANITLNGGRSRTPSNDVVLPGKKPQVPLALPPKALPTTKAPVVVAPPQPPSSPPVTTAPVIPLPPPPAVAAAAVVPPPPSAHPIAPVATVKPIALPIATPPLVPSSSSSSTSVMTGIQKPLGLQQPQHPSLQQVHSQVLGNQQKRRRVRSSSSRAESITGDDTPEWSDAEFGGRSGGRKLGRTTSLSESKRPAYSSYWSVSERNEFLRLLSIYGRDWERVANEMKSKTVIQVRNFYVNNEEKMQLKQVVDRHHSNKQPHDSPKTFDTSAAAHFQALQNFPFPSPIIDQPQQQQSAIVTTTPITNYSPSRVRYYSSPPPPQSSLSPRNTTNYPSSSSTSQQQQQHNRNLSSTVEPVPSAVTKVADLLNNDDSAEPNQNWETWFGS